MYHRGGGPFPFFSFGTEASAGLETGLLFVTIVELQISHTHKFSKSKFQWL
jgi:hypothetical protein